MRDSLPVGLEQLLGAAPRLGPLARLGLRTVGDLLFHFPRSYEDLTDLRPIAALTSGALQTVQGEVVEMDTRYLNDGGFVVSVVLNDGGPRSLEGAWFNQAHVTRRFRYGQRLSFSGKARWQRDHWQMVGPRVQILDPGVDVSTPGIVPVYPLTEDLRPDHLRPLIGRAIDLHAPSLPEVLPEELRQRHGWPGVLEALRAVHFPSSLEAAERGRRRFVYEELLLCQLALALRRRETRDRRSAPVLAVTEQIDARIRRLFPFPLTGDQDRAIADVCRDLASGRPMQRLVQADVGAGKTAVAAYALLVAVACKHQAALMAPTEVLARQHAATLEGYLANSRVRRLLLTGALTPRERRAALDALKAGEIDLVVGTQSLVQEGVEFARLGLVVIDEQHKFGVQQRARVRRLGADPHYLVMTATPIPRTVALTVFGDLDVSLIRELPPGRQPVATRWLSEAERDRAHALLREGLEQKKQAYVVCPLIEEAEGLDVKSATRTYEELRSGPFRGFRVGLLHGRQDDATKADAMARFRAHEIDLLVCTSVVEVGIDVPNATLLLIERAERFGLSQLHQLRGRVSRGAAPGLCLLFAQPAGDEGRERLRALLRSTDGFALAEEDARLRGVGELFGSRQHGAGELLVGARDAGLLDVARRDAFALVDGDPELRREEHAGLREAVWRRYGETLELSEVG